MTITRKDERFYAVQAQRSAGDQHFDGHCVLDGRTLRSYEERGYVRTGGLMKIALGPVSFAAVSELAIGSSVSFS